MDSDFFQKPEIRIGVLASGRGSNLAAILRAQQAGQFAKARIVVVASNIASARALDIARDAGIPAVTVLPKEYASPADYERAMLAAIQEHGVDLVVLAGYMKLLGPVLLEGFPHRIINIHPSLLPAFPGLCAQRQALEYGVRFSGCTVHFVDAGVDSGPVIGQRMVPVLPGDTEESLSTRILAQEHELFPAMIKLLTEHRWRLNGRIFELLDETPLWP